MRKNFLIIMLVFFICNACNDNFTSSIPNVSFSFTIDTRQARYSSITIAGHFVTTERIEAGSTRQLGYGGLIIGQSLYPDFDNRIVYYAFDRACPVEAAEFKLEQLELVEGGVGKAVCNGCDTEYDLNNAGAPRGVGIEYLKTYSISAIDSYSFLIQNR